MQMSLWAEAPAKISAKPELEQAFQESVISGRRCAALLESVGQESLFMRMFAEECQRDFSTAYVSTWNLTATTFGRWFIQLQYSVRPMSATKCFTSGYWPTPTHSDDRNREPSPTPVLTSNGTYRHLNAAGEQSQMRLSQVVKMWATPNRRDHTNPSKPTDGRIQRKIAEGWTIDLNDLVQFSSPAGYL